MNKVYLLENLCCANCAAKIEKKVSELSGVDEVTLTFTTKQLRITAENPDDYLAQIQKIASAIEPDVIIKERVRKPAAAEEESCGCDHGDHHHSEEEKCSGEHEHHHAETEPHDSMHSIHHHSEKHEKTPFKVSELHTILSGTLLFVFGIFIESDYSIVSLILFVVAYLILGGSILLTAGKNIARGQVFDENFLMSIATLGAFAIQQYPEAVGVMLFFRIGEYFEERAVEKSRGQIMAAIDLRPEVVNLMVNSDVQTIPAEKAKKGDIILVRPGDRIPLDGIVIEGESRIDTAPITGEPVPVRAFAGERVISGCINTSGALKIKVEKSLEESMVTQILDSVENAAASKPKIDRFITRFARIYTPFVVVLAALTAILPSLITGDWHYWIYTALTFLVISCPCALVLSVPLAFFSGIGAGSKKGILFKGGLSLEAIKNVKAIVMDKTGTLTKGEFTVQKMTCTGTLFTTPPQQILDAISPTQTGNVSDTRGLTNKAVENYLLFLAASCELNSTHPIAVSIVNAANSQQISLERPSSVEETAGKGLKATLSAGEVLCGNRKLLTENGVDIEGFPPTAGGSEILIALNHEFIGALTISDTIKSDSASAISKLKKLGIKTVMLTGDSKESADLVAAKTGIEEVYAKLLPDEKLRILKEIRAAHGAVMFVGDGINDTPVLAGADVGAAMGSGADAAIEAADIVFMTSSMEAVPESIAIAKITTRIAMQNVVFALLIKGLVMVLGLLGLASMWMAVFADSGVAMLCVLNSIRILYSKSLSN
ncbi:heavy metal translocating P-type ATPase [Clostridium aminobutyricum]|uniref:Cd(2+)-exporting ATPase n=1 Tax=Clostridium aminobutyricum TaxID=33953 RepID=A0A939D870_CLOAM|nr:heavy metal translocating P-type ATPase [Clostridium aminobutyricum]MBN7773209.1 heavy metal translocating P-type ATPase [Clostridium aminobutyricum]